MTPDERLRLIDFKYIEDAITPEEALEIFRRAEVGKAERIKEMEETGYLAYITSTGWIAYTAEQVRDLTAEALKTGLKYIKIKVGSDIDSDIARLSAVREVLGPDRFLMVDANQKWGVKQAIEWMERLAPFKPLWIEEPTSPDDILGHKAVRDALYPKYGIGVATGEVRTVGCCWCGAANRLRGRVWVAAAGICEPLAEVDAHCRQTAGGVARIVAGLLSEVRTRTRGCCRIMWESPL
jgi:L-fuconate dehydratase